MRLTCTMALLGAVVELCGMSKRNREFPACIGLIDRRLVGTVVTNNAQQSRRTGLDTTHTPRARAVRRRSMWFAMHVYTYVSMVTKQRNVCRRTVPLEMQNDTPKRDAPSESDCAEPLSLSRQQAGRSH